MIPLIQKSEDYVQVLLHQTNVQNLVKKLQKPMKR